MCFFFNDTATTEIYTLSLHDALPIYDGLGVLHGASSVRVRACPLPPSHQTRCALRCVRDVSRGRSEEHTSELQSRQYLVCRLLLEKKIKSHSPRYFMERIQRNAVRPF